MPKESRLGHCGAFDSGTVRYSGTPIVSLFSDNARDACGSRTHFNRVAAGRLTVWLQRRIRRAPRLTNLAQLIVRTSAVETHLASSRVEASALAVPGCRLTVSE